MINGYLCPLSEDLIEFKSNLSRGTLGSNITLYNSEKTDYSSIDIAIIFTPVSSCQSGYKS